MVYGIIPPQRSLLVSWLFSVIPISCLKILFFNILVKMKWDSSGTTNNKVGKNTLAVFGT